MASISDSNIPVPCGGAVSLKASDLLPFTLESVSTNAVYRARIGMAGGPATDIIYAEPLIHLVNRREFDFRLIKAAANLGVEVHENETFQSLEETAGGCIVHSDKDRYVTGFIVGADGVLSRVRGYLNLKWKPLLGITLEGEYPIAHNSHSWSDDGVSIDLGHVEKWYGWIFPKDNILSVGLGTFCPKYPGMKDLLEEYLTLKGLGSVKPQILQGFPIPADGAVKKMLHGKLGLVVGDAAGLVDRFTGEGIYYALLSGKIAGEVMSEALEQGRQDLSGYSRRVYSEITKKLRSGARLATLVYKFPRQAVELVIARPELGQTLLEAVYGKQSYNQLYLSLLQGLVMERLKSSSISFLFRT
ncbi:MAG TPA: NAD(P)/FAD-dependent oxidoreductase [Bacillota bacterium]|nr:NAD(P)/FAD-dependent oxidoreductase [Bacillota bacterium]